MALQRCTSSSASQLEVGRSTISTATATAMTSDQLEEACHFSTSASLTSPSFGVRSSVLVLVVLAKYRPWSAHSLWLWSESIHTLYTYATARSSGLKLIKAAFSFSLTLLSFLDFLCPCCCSRFNFFATFSVWSYPCQPAQWSLPRFLTYPRPNLQPFPRPRTVGRG